MVFFIKFNEFFMPELPEVETIRLDLEKTLVAKKIVSLQILSANTVKHTKSFFDKKLLGFNFSDISRRGKLLIFKISGADNFLLIHLKMTGQLIYLEGKNKVAGGHSLKEGSFLEAVGGDLPNKHTRVVFNFEDNSRLFFNDLRKFGYLKIIGGEELIKILAENYGPEPLEKRLDEKYLEQVFKNRLRPIKNLLLDQKIIAGLGNIYVDEALFLAGILPARSAKSLKNLEITKLVKAIKNVIALALKKRGTTFSDYLDSKGRKGNFSKFLKVYGRQDENCLNCQREIIKIKLGGRGTHYCSKCQK